MHIPIKNDCNYCLLEKLILMQRRSCKVMWLIMTDKDTISVSDGHKFSTDSMLTIIKILPTS